jgi:hypothetical protein
MRLGTTADKVKDAESFLNFVRELIADREDEARKEQVSPSAPFASGANGWENGQIETFLEAAVAWADASNFVEKQNDPAYNPWQQFAQFLHAGKIYE